MILPLSLLACVCGAIVGATDGPQRRSWQRARMEVSRSASSPARPRPGRTGSPAMPRSLRCSIPKGASQVGAALVRFEPGARTAWHKHPLGQRLVVTEGSGWTQVEGGPGRGDPRRRRRLVPAGRAPLAWRNADHGDGAHRDPGSAERLARHLDGACQRRGLSEGIRNDPRCAPAGPRLRPQAPAARKQPTGNSRGERRARRAGAST